MKCLRHCFGSIVVLLFVASSTQARLSMDVSAGFDGKSMPQSWVPVLVEFFNDGPPVEGFVEISTPPPARGTVYTKPVVVPTNSRKRFWLYPHVGSYITRYEVTLVSLNGRVIAASSVPLQMLQGDTRLLAAATRSEINLLPFTSKGNEENPVLSARMRPAALPDDAVGFEGMHALVLSDAAESEWTPGQRQALRNWVGLGGHLVVSVNNADNFIKSRFWEELLPMRITGSEVAPGISEIQSISRGSPGSLRSGTPVAVGEVWRGNARVSAGKFPLVVESTFGRGRVTLLTFNIEREPFRSWGAKEAFWRGLLDLPVQTPPVNHEQNFVQWGGRNYDDIFRGLLEAKLEKRISLWWLLGLIGCYLVVIGPFDYWLVRHKLKRPVLTWITFPCYVVGFSALIYGIGYALKSGDSELVQISYIDVVPEAKLTRGITATGFYSTSNRRYGFQGALPESHFRLATSGIENPSATATIGGDTRVIETDQGFAVALPVPIWSSKTFVTEWLGDDAPIDVTRSTVGNDTVLDVTNRLPVKLTGVYLISNGNVRKLDDVTPNGAAREIVTRHPPQQTVEAWTQPFNTFLARYLPMMGFGFQTVKPEDIPPWQQVLYGLSFPVKLGQSNQHLNVTPWRGASLSESKSHGEIILLAYVEDFPINGYQPRFKPDRIRHHALLRCVIKP